MKQVYFITIALCALVLLCGFYEKIQELGYYKGKAEQLEKYVQLANPKQEEFSESLEIESPEIKIKGRK